MVKKTIAQKIASAKSKPASLKNTKEIEVVSKSSLNKVNKIIVNEASKARATKRNTGAVEQTLVGIPSSQKGVKYTYEKGLEKAAKTAVKQGKPKDVQRIRASQSVDAAKTAMRARMIESRNSRKIK
jgi:hypothetical protein